MNIKQGFGKNLANKQLPEGLTKNRKNSIVTKEGNMRGINPNQVKLYGCKSPCIFMMSQFCPHKDDEKGVTFTNEHENGLCEFRQSFIIESVESAMTTKEITRLSYTDELIFREILDDSWIANYRKSKALQSGEDIDYEQALKWAKQASDLKLRWQKHKEGSKVEVTNNSISPSQYQSMVNNIDESKIVDAEYENIETLEDDKQD